MKINLQMATLSLIVLLNAILSAAALASAETEQDHNHNHSYKHNVHNDNRQVDDKQDSKHLVHDDQNKTVESHDQGHGAHAVQSVELSDTIVNSVGLTLATAGPTDIDPPLRVYGKIVTDSARVSHLRARFPGTVTRVNVALGDRVNRGEVLVDIESNESLKRYSMRAPFAGVVSAHHATPGELAGDQVLLVIANLDRLWAELRVFPTQIKAVKVGQVVNIQGGGQQLTAKIASLIPSADEQPFILARVPIDNRHGQWVPGLMLAASVSTQRKAAPVAVANRALQSFEGEPVVFVREGQHYRVRPLILGRRDDQFTEVLQGLEVGDRYVLDNSYLIKAELEKASASHHH